MIAYKISNFYAAYFRKSESMHFSWADNPWKIKAVSGKSKNLGELEK